MQRSVFADYGAFIRHVSRRLLPPPRLRCVLNWYPHAHARSTAKEIADLQSDLSRSRAILAGMGAVLTSLREPGAASDGLAAGGDVSTPDKGARRHVRCSEVAWLRGTVTLTRAPPHSLLAFDLSTPAPVSTAATEALTELTEQLEVLIGALSSLRCCAVCTRCRSRTPLFSSLLVRS